MEGFWTVEFGSSAGMFGGGVIILENGHAFGGDGTYFYIGAYSVDGGSFKAELRISPFIAGAVSVFGTSGREYTLVLEGSRIGENQATAQGYPKEMPGLKFAAKLTKRA